MPKNCKNPVKHCPYLSEINYGFFLVIKKKLKKYKIIESFRRRGGRFIFWYYTDMIIKTDNYFRLIQMLFDNFFESI